MREREDRERKRRLINTTKMVLTNPAKMEHHKMVLINDAKMALINAYKWSGYGRSFKTKRCNVGDHYHATSHAMQWELRI